MQTDRIFFKKSKSYHLNGYYIPVRNSWNYKLQYELISERDKEQYEKDFGREIITDIHFYEWLAAQHGKRMN